MKIKPIVFSISGAIIISLFFTLSLFWIFYEYSGSQNSTKDAISTLSGYFGGIATLWAAIIAAYLFNDWRKIKQYEIILNYVMLIKTNSQEYRKYINSIRKFYIEDMVALGKLELSEDSFRDIVVSVYSREKEIINILETICLDANELYYLKYKKNPDPTIEKLRSKIQYLQGLGITTKNYHDAYYNRLKSNPLKIYFEYLINDLSVFVYDEVFTKYLDELILDSKAH